MDGFRYNSIAYFSEAGSETLEVVAIRKQREAILTIVRKSKFLSIGVCCLDLQLF